MKGNSLSKIEHFIRLYAKYLKPKFYNKITWLLVFAGVSLISTSLIERILEGIVEKVIQLDPTGGNSWLFGLALIILGLSYNLLNVYLEETSKRNVNKEKHLELSAHDLRNFEKLDAVLPEKDVLTIIDAIATNHMFEKDQKAIIEGYFYLASETVNRYLIDEIEKANIEYLSSINEFCSFLSQHFFFPKHSPSMKFLYLYPDLSPDRGTDLSQQSQQIYFQRSKELNEVTLQLEGKLKHYRRKIKEILYV